METIVLSNRDVAALLPYTEVTGMVDTVFNEWGKGNVVMPPKINLDMSRSGFDSWSNAMPAHLVSSNAAGIKWIGGYKNNPSKGLPYIMGIIILTDPETGGTLAVMNGIYISDWRTGASAAVAAKYLAKSNVKKIAMIGAGAQGKTASVCINQIFPKAQIAVADISPEKRQAFIREMQETFKIKITDAHTVEAAVSGADVVVLLTTAKNPIVKKEWLSEGCVTLAMGSYQQTADDLILSSDKIIVDSWGQAAHRGELKKLTELGKLSEKDIYAELGFIGAGKKNARENDKERIMAVLVGLGAHDVFIAGQVYKKAIENKTGQKIQLD
jgi:ornithine cyclodeaminase/alanine dehydrogenase